jgi:sugar (pentulose or hexulose) kinase
VWRRIAADVLRRPLSFYPSGERAGAGAALIAGIGAGMYSGYGDLARLADQPVQVTEPGPDAADYDALYARFVAASAHAAAQ